MVRDSAFTEVTEKMRGYLSELEACEPISMESRADRRALRSKVPGDQGVYVLYEHGQPMYVGRSDRLVDRLLEHAQPSGGSEGATFAFILAEKEFGPSSMTRAQLQRDNGFRPLFDDAKERVSKMQVRAVRVEDSIEQTILEVYLHKVLGTPHNSFDNH